MSIQSFTITKTLDKSSPLLFQAAATGQHYKEATLSFTRKAGGKEQTYLKFDFQNVLISSVQDGSSGGGTPQEQVTFAFQKVVGGLHRAERQDRGDRRTSTFRQT